MPPNSLEEVRIHGEIGDDPAELETVADTVARGCSICYTRIKSLRALVKAVQRRPGTNLAPPREERPEEWKPPDGDSSDESLTALRICGGEILDGDCRSLDIRVTLALATHFAGDASFSEASLAFPPATDLPPNYHGRRISCWGKGQASGRSGDEPGHLHASRLST